MEIECEYLDDDDGFPNSPTFPEEQNSNDIFLTPDDDPSLPTFQDANGTQSVNQLELEDSTGTKQDYSCGVAGIDSLSPDTEQISELDTFPIPEYSPVHTPTHNSTLLSTIECATSYNADTLDASTSPHDSMNANPADCVSNDNDNSSLLNFPISSPPADDSSDTNNPTNGSSIQNNGDILAVDFGSQEQTLANDFSDLSSQLEASQLNESSPGILLNTDSNEQTLENQIETSHTSNITSFLSQSQTLDMSYGDVSESPHNPQPITQQSQTLESAINSCELSSLPASLLSTLTNGQTLENDISRHQGDQQLVEECHSHSPHHSPSNSQSHDNSGTTSITRVRQLSNENSSDRELSLPEDSHLQRGCYTSTFKYSVQKYPDRNIQVGAGAPVRLPRKRRRPNSIFPCEETEVQINENPISLAESVVEIDQSILSSLDITLKSLAAEAVEDSPICISSEESEDEPDLYTQIQLLDSKNFDLNIAIADLDYPKPSQNIRRDFNYTRQCEEISLDLPVPPPVPTSPDLSDSEPAPKVRKPRKVPENIGKRSKPKRDPTFRPYTRSTDVSSDESEYTPKNKKLKKLQESAGVGVERSSDVAEKKVGRPRKYDQVLGPPKARSRKRRYHRKKRHGPTYYARLKERAILEGRYIPKLQAKKKQKHLHKKVRYHSDSEYSDESHTRGCRNRDSGWGPGPMMELWSKGDTAYDVTMQTLSSKQTTFSVAEHFNSPYLKKIQLPAPHPEQNIEMKMIDNGNVSKASFTHPQGLRLINADILAGVFEQFNCPLNGCKRGKLKLCESTLKRGVQNAFVIFCSRCGNIVTRFCSSRQLDQPISSNIGMSIKGFERSEANIRAMLGVHTTSLTWKGFTKFASIMDLPTPTKSMRRSEQMKFAEIVLAEVDDSMRKWSKFIAERQDAVQSVRPGCVEVAVSFDGSWKQRGHYSNVGFAAVIERHSKKVVDYELLNRNCEACSKWSTHMMETKQKEYAAWYEAHKPHCKSNFSGTSLAMESEAAVRMWNRSEDRGLVYSVFIGDGDGSGYKTVLKSGVYNGEVNILKEECIGHLQKRLKNHLMKATKNTRNTTYVKHALEEHKADRVAHLFAVVVGQHVGKPPEEMSQALWRMLGHISENHDECPLGPKSYCLYQKHLYRHQMDPSAPAPKQRRCYFTDIDLEKIHEEFHTYASADVCSHLTLGATQNINESLHSCIWSSCLKTKYTSPTCVAISVALSVLCFNEGQSALVGVLLALGIEPSMNSIKEFVSKDIARVHMREMSKTDQRKANRRQRKIDSKNREARRRKQDRETSRILYQSDKHGIEVKDNSNNSAKKSKGSRKSKVPPPAPAAADDDGENEHEADLPDAAGDEVAESGIVEAMETEIHDTAEFQAHQTAPAVQGEKATPVKAKKNPESKTKKTNEGKQKKATEPKQKKTTEPKQKKTTEPKQKKTTEPKQKKTTEPKQKKTNKDKQKKTTEDEASKSETKEDNALKAAAKRKKRKIPDKSDTEDEYTEGIIKKHKLRKRQRSPSPPADSGAESDGVCNECELRTPAGTRRALWKWIGCERCENWFHDSCMGVHLEDFGDEDFICKACS